MGTRKHFVTAGGLLGAALIAKAEAAKPKGPSPAAREFARRMRKYDSSLTAQQLAEIEKNIDDLWNIGGKVHKDLANGDGTSPAFRVGE
ncbi:MAG: hypothetical protein ACREJX_11510 [Polyangiaceae bacterium]